MREGRGEHEPREWVDSWSLSRERFGGSAQRHGLDALARKVGVRARAKGAAHDAGGDAELLARCWLAWGAPKAVDLFGGEPKVEEGPMAPVLEAPAPTGGMAAWRGRWRKVWEQDRT